MKNKYIIILFSLVLIPMIAQAQQAERVSLEEAVAKALEENHNIIISRNLAEIEENSATIGNAGYLPSLSLNSSYDESLEDTRLEFSDGNTNQDVSASRSSQFNSSLNLEWVLFDGFGNRYRMQSLDQGQDLGEVQTRLEIENTLIEVIERYLEVKTESQLLEVSLEAVDISNQRYRRAERNFQAGGGSRVDLLNAEVDLNQDSIQVVETELNLNRAKRNLQVLLGQDPSGDISVEQSLQIEKDLTLNPLLETALQENAQLTASNIESEQARLQLSQSQAERFPEISTNASYNYNRANNDAGQFTFQETNGFSAGLTLRFNIFDGFRQNIVIQNDQIRLKNTREQREQIEKELKSNLMNAYENYNANLYLLEKQQLNVETAELNFERTREAFEQGQVSNTDFREAQLNLLENRQDLISRQAEAKLAEVDLLQLSGLLLTNLQ